MKMRAAFLVVLFSATSGCSAAFWDSVAKAGPPPIPGAATPAASLSGIGDLPTYPQFLLFGGEGHKTFLGCLNCSKFDTESVMNTYGAHGNKFSSESIFNSFSDFGSKFSSYSPCNLSASDPPVIVDRDGNYYGRLTINRNSQIKNATINAWISGVCAGR